MLRYDDDLFSLRSASGGRSRQIGWTWPFASPGGFPTGISDEIHGNHAMATLQPPTSNSSVRASWRSWKFFITKSQPQLRPGRPFRFIGRVELPLAGSFTAQFGEK